MALFFLSVQSKADIVVTPDKTTQLHLTLYSGFALVQQVRTTSLPKGTNTLRFESIAPQAEVESIILDFVGSSDVTLLSQNYEYDLVNARKLLENFIGKNVDIIHPGSDSQIVSAEVISASGPEPLFRVGNRIMYGRAETVLFPYFPEDLFMVPTVLARINARKRLDTKVRIRYLCHDVQWYPDYILEFSEKDKRATLQARVTIKNNAGMQFEDATLSFVAGNPSKSSSHQRYGGATLKREMHFASSAAAMESDSRISGGSNAQEYPVYNLQTPITLQQGEGQQLPWFTEKVDDISIVYELRPLRSWYVRADQQDRQSASVTLNFTSKQPLLPQGRIRTYESEKSSPVRFRGEDVIVHSAKNTPIKVEVGSSVFITGEYRELIGFSKLQPRSKRQVTIYNEASFEVSVKVYDYIARSQSLVESSVTAKQPDSETIAWDLIMEPESKKTITYTISQK